MRKSTRIVKRLLALFLVVLMSINTFGAVVSDNDGSAFITKAEFDSMKNAFQSQIDQYNTSIDSKVDGAIASYLSGLQLSKEQKLDTILSKANLVTLRNYELPNRYGCPGFNLSMTYYGAGCYTSNWNQYPSAYGIGCVGVGLATASQLKSVGLISGNEVDYNNLTKNKFFWTGIINDYEERINGARLGYNDYQDVGGATKDIKLKVFDTVKLMVDNQYYTASQKKDFWKNNWVPTLQGSWKNHDTPRTTNWNPVWAGGFFSWGQTYSKSLITNEYEYTFVNVNENVINPDFNSCFYNFTDNNTKSSTMLSSMKISKSGTWMKGNSDRIFPCMSDGTYTGDYPYPDTSGIGNTWTYGILESHYNPSSLDAEVFDGARDGSSSGAYNIPTLGGLGPIASNRIYIQKDNLRFTFNNREYEKTVTTMNDGFPLLYALKDTEITWEPVFSDIKGNLAVRTNGEVNVILSYGEFGNGSSSSGGYVQSDGSKASIEYVFTTNEKKKKIKWTMAEDGWIYVKWFPAALTSTQASINTSDNDKWSISLDGSKSNTITYLIND